MSSEPPAKPTRRERARRIRRFAVTWTVVAFVAAWGLIYTQMRAGHDPALTSGASAATATTVVQPTTTDDGTDTAEYDPTTRATDERAAVTSSATATDEPAAVTTSQS
jgi:hypothetical protein